MKIFIIIQKIIMFPATLFYRLVSPNHEVPKHDSIYHHKFED